MNNITLDDYMNLTYKFCSSKDLADFINMQIQYQQKVEDTVMNLKGNAWPTSPKLYKKKVMEKFSLPSPSTLYRFLQNLKIYAGIISADLLQMLKTKVDNFPKQHKFCVL